MIKTYENFPIWIPLVAITLSILIYLLGAYILSGFGLLISILYLLYCLGVELLVVFRSCVYCYYYGKLCGLGKGRFAPIFIKKGDPKKFTERPIRWYSLVPDFLTVIFPIVGGVYSLTQGCTWFCVGLLIVFVLMFFGGTAAIRGSLACKYCKQRELGCPAEKLFNKEAKSKD